ISNRVLSGLYLCTLTIAYDVAHTTDNNHDYGNNTDNKDHCIDNILDHWQELVSTAFAITSTSADFACRCALCALAPLLKHINSFCRWHDAKRQDTSRYDTEADEYR